MKNRKIRNEDVAGFLDILVLVRKWASFRLAYFFFVKLFSLKEGVGVFLVNGKRQIVNVKSYALAN